MIQLAWPLMLLLLPLPWLIRRWMPPVSPQSESTLFAPFALGLVELPSQTTRSSFRIRQIFSMLIWSLIVVAASRPEWLGEAIEMPETGRNLMFAVDVSGSMGQTDLVEGNNQATRLDVVKAVAGDFIKRRNGDRLGLILFGSKAYLQAPLSFDRTTVGILLRQAMIGIAGRETAIGDAIGLAVKRLREAPEGKAVLILLTDGANTAGTVDPLQAAKLAKQAGLRIHTIGVGAEQMRVRGFFGSQVVNPSADLDEETLTSIAEQTGGLFFRAKDMQGLQQVYERLDELEPVKDGSRVVRPIIALYYWPLGVALVLSLSLALLNLVPVSKQWSV